MAGRAVLIATGWDRHWGTDAYLSDNPFLTAEAAALLVNRGAALVGIDSLNIDSLADPSRPAHTAILGAGTELIERAQRAGVVRADTNFLDVGRMVSGIALVPTADPGQKERLLQLALDGLRYRPPDS